MPDTGTTFAGWTGGCTGTSPCTLDLTEGKAVAASFTLKRFALTTSTTGNGSGTITLSPTGGTYNYGTLVTVTANPATGSTFTGFGGDCSGTTCTVRMTQARSVTAGFDLVPETLTVTSGAGEHDHVQSRGHQLRRYDLLEGLRLQHPGHADRDPRCRPAARRLGRRCSGVPATSPTCTVTMTQARAVTATFSAIPETLTVTSGSGGKVVSTPAGISCTSAGGAGCTHAFAYGTPVTLTPSPATGSTCTGCAGECSSTGPCQVTMTQARSVTAGFNLIPETLTVTKAAPAARSRPVPRGVGCAGTTCSKDFDYGTPVTLTATPDVGQQLTVCNGACSGLFR